MGSMVVVSAFEDERARYSGGFRVIPMMSLGVAAFGGRALVLRIEPRVSRVSPLSGVDR
jgi:hypothetical protein